VHCQTCRKSKHEKQRPFKCQGGRACAVMLQRSLLHFIVFANFLCVETTIHTKNTKNTLSEFNADVDATHCRSPVPPIEMQRCTRLTLFSTTTSFKRSTCIMEDIRSKPIETEQRPCPSIAFDFVQTFLSF